MSDLVEPSGQARPLATLNPKRKLNLLAKVIVDVTFTLLAVPIILAISLILLTVNPFFNPGPLFFFQDRMGKDGRKFRMWKFRTMLPAPELVRAHDAPLEVDRITSLGKFLRRTRIDELPNFFNVLMGDMSLIGPRPDAWSHALVHRNTIPHYRQRFRVRPGITGLAQVRGGYADCDNSIRRKASLDRIYADRADFGLDIYILLRTLRVVFTGFGAR